MQYNLNTKKTDKKRENRQLCVTAGLALGVFALIFLIRDLFPLGDGSILMIDLHSQYMPLLYRFYDVVTGQKNLFLDLSASGGAYLYADTVNELLNPFNYLLLLFGRSRIYLAANVLLACYGTAAAVTACFCLQKLWPDRRDWNVPLSLMYVFSGFMGAQFQIIKWLYLFVLFPLFVLAFVRLLRERKWGFYALLLGYQLMLSLQLGAMLLLFALFGSAFYFSYEKKAALYKGLWPENRQKTVASLVIGTLTGVLLSAVVLVPNVLQLLGSARGSENLSYFSVMRQHGLNDLFERLYLMFHPVLFAVGVFSLRRTKKWEKGDSRKYLLLWNVFLWVTVILQPSNLLWHLGSYMCFPVRYAYMILFSEVLFVKALTVSEENTKDAVEETGAAGRKRLSSVCLVIGMLLLAAAAVILTCMWAVPISQGFSSLAISNVKSAVIKVAGILVLMTAAGICAMMCRYWKRIAVTAAACVMGGIFFLFVMLPQEYPVRQMNENAYREMNAAAENRTEENEFSHLEEVDGWPLNSTLVSGGRTMTGYFPSGSGRDYASAMEKLGYLTPWVSTRSCGGTAISDSLLGIVREVPEGFEYPVFTKGIVLNKDAEELAAAYAQSESSDPLQAQQMLGSFVTDQEILKVVGLEELNETETGGRELELSKKNILYLDASDIAANILVWVNGTALELPEAMSAESPHRILTMGYFEAGTVTVQVTDRSGNELPVSGKKLGILDVEQWKNALNDLYDSAAGALEIDDRDAKITVSTEQSGILLLPAAYTDGWSVRRNGEKAELFIWADGFLGVEIPEESVQDQEAVAEFTFVPPGLRIGACLFGIGGLILLAAWIRRRRTEASEKRNCGKFLAGLYIIVLCIGVAGIYLVPNAGLAVHIVMKAFGIERSAQENGQPALRIAQTVETGNGIRVDLVKENLMLKKGVKVRADSEEGKSFKADAVRDGIVDVDSNRWSSENNWENNEHWLQVDFSEGKQIVCVKLFWERTNACEYALEYSSDKKEWKTAAVFDQAPSEKEQTVFLETPVQARYLRLHVWNVKKDEEDLSLYYQNVSLKELEVYGETAGNLLIEAPEISDGTDRKLNIPVLEDGYSLRFGGADYGNLIDEDGNIADTLSPVEIELGFILEKDGVEWELPGIKTVIPASDSGTDHAVTGEEEDTDKKTAVNETVLQAAEWKADENSTVLADNVQICLPDPSDVTEDSFEQELLSGMAELFRTELDAFLPDEKAEGTVDHVEQIHFILESEEDNDLGEEGCEIRIREQEISVIANSAQGIRWGCVTLLDMLNESEMLPRGTLRDYPHYEVRGFGIDVGRRAISLDLLYEMVKALSYQKMNTLQIHLNDNQIISQSEYDGTVEGARNLYAGFRLESDLKNSDGLGITSTDLYYTKQEFMQLISDAAVYGVEIVPEIDTPAHSLSLTKVFPELGMDGDPEAVDMLDLSKETARQLGMGLWKEYLTDAEKEQDSAVFAQCQALHLGMDEYFGDAKDYLVYLKELSDYVNELAPDKELRIWGSLTMKGGDLSGISRELQMHIWDVQWADPTEMYEEGFSLINSLSSHLYLIPGGGYDWLDRDYLETKWQPNVYDTTERSWTIPAWSDRCLGACYMMWNDWASVNGEEITEEGLFDRFIEPLPVIADKLW